MDAITEVFPELHEESGVYAQLVRDDERKCSISSVMSAIWLWTDRYGHFVSQQDAKTRMSLKEWEGFQQFVKWANLSVDQILSLIHI